VGGGIWPGLGCRFEYAGAWVRRTASTILTAIFAVLFGLAFGSFLNVCIARLPRHRSIVRPGSACPNCGKAIRAWDNLPLLSFAILRGRCRTCRWPIPWRYPAVELATAALFLLAYLRFGLTLAGAGAAVLSFLLLGLAVMDAETMRLPDAFTLPGIVLGIVWSGLEFGLAKQWPGALLWSANENLAIGATKPHAQWKLMIAAMIASALWALLAAFLIWLIRWLYHLLRHREGMGLGDAKLLAMIAAWLGPALTGLTFVLGTFAAAVFGIALAARSRRSPDQTMLPFGSFLCAAAIYALFAGQPVLHWYAGFFHWYAGFFQ
jgi:leader peptidase (prepilin peptidase)/N-methyltransferase